MKSMEPEAKPGFEKLVDHLKSGIALAEGVHAVLLQGIWRPLTSDDQRAGNFDKEESSLSPALVGRAEWPLAIDGTQGRVKALSSARNLQPAHGAENLHVIAAGIEADCQHWRKSASTGDTWLRALPVGD